MIRAKSQEPLYDNAVPAQPGQVVHGLILRYFMGE